MEPQQINGIQTERRIFFKDIYTKVGLLVFLFLLVIIPLIVFSFKKPQEETKTTQKITPTRQRPQPVKTWEFTFSYQQKTNTLTVDQMQIKKGVVAHSPLSHSPFVLKVLDISGTVLHQQGITINKFLFDEPTQPSEISSIITVPYKEAATSIQILIKDAVLLTFTPPKDISFSVQPVYAEEPDTCFPISVVFISEGYTNMEEFKSDVEKAKNKILNTYPYSLRKDLFQFLVIENTEALGCVTEDNLFESHCITKRENQQKINDIAYSSYPDLPRNPDYTKFVMLVQSDPSPRGALGTASDIGGNYISIWADDRYDTYEKAAIHEIGGHAIGHLFDRYIYPDPDNTDEETKGLLVVKDDWFAFYPPSNCSAKPEGELLWQQARDAKNGQNAYPGCSGINFYAPGPRTCSNPQAGTKESYMSASNCEIENRFDAVEEQWIANHILNNYPVCGQDEETQATPTPTPEPEPEENADDDETDAIDTSAICDGSLQKIACSGNSIILRATWNSRNVYGGDSCNVYYRDGDGDHQISNNCQGTQTITKILVPGEYKLFVSNGVRKDDEEFGEDSCYNIDVDNKTFVCSVSPTRRPTPRPSTVPPTQTPSPSPTSGQPPISLIITEANIDIYDLENVRGHRCLNLDDLFEMARILATFQNNARADLNQDDSVNILDFNILVNVLREPANTSWLCSNKQ